MKPWQLDSGLHLCNHSATMIDCTTNISYKAFAKARAERPWFRTLAPGKMKIIPKRPPHDIYVVEFQKRGRAYLATCKSFRTGHACIPNHHGQYCYHVAWAITQLIRKQKRQETIAA